MNEIKDDNKFLVGILVLGLVCVIAWFCHDLARNKPTYNNTDSTVADIDKRIQSAEQRIESMQRRIEQNQKTIESVERGISTSTGLAIEIEEGTGRAEDRLDSAIARTERIKGIIADIEKANR